MSYFVTEYPAGSGAWRVAYCNDDGFVDTYFAPSGSREEAEAELVKVLASPKCCECGEPEPGRYVEPVVRVLRERRLCFKCNHWFGLEKRKNDPKIVRVNGEHYTIGKEPSLRERRSGMLGFGGAKFVVRFHDGREVVSHNMWYQGHIPPRWRERLPDNAEFVKDG